MKNRVEKGRYAEEGDTRKKEVRRRRRYAEEGGTQKKRGHEKIEKGMHKK